MITFWFGWPINGNAFGFTLDAEDGDNVQNTNVELSLNLYLMAFWLVFVKFWFTGSALLFDVTTRNKFGILASGAEVFVFRYSIL